MIEQINRIAEIWWNWMWPMFWQVSVLIGFIALIDFLIRKHVWPQLRYALWLLVLVKLLLPPSFALRTGVVSHVQPLVERSIRQPVATDGSMAYPSIDEHLDWDGLSAEELVRPQMLAEPVLGSELVESSVQVNPERSNNKRGPLELLLAYNRHDRMDSRYTVTHAPANREAPYVAACTLRRQAWTRFA